MIIRTTGARGDTLGATGGRMSKFGRLEKRSQAADLVATAPQAMREHLAPFVGEFCEQLLADMRDPNRTAHRTAMTLIPQILRAVGAETQLVINLWQRLGARDEGHVQQLVATALEAETVDDEGAWRLSEQYAADYRRRHGLPELVEATSAASRSDAVDGPGGSPGSPTGIPGRGGS